MRILKKQYLAKSHIKRTSKSRSRMTFENCVCLIFVLFFIGFMVELLRGRFKIVVAKKKRANTSSQRQCNSLFGYRPYQSDYTRPYNNANHNARSQHNNPQRNRNNQSGRSNASRTNTSSISNNGLPSYQASTAAMNNINSSR